MISAAPEAQWSDVLMFLAGFGGAAFILFVFAVAIVAFTYWLDR